MVFFTDDDDCLVPHLWGNRLSGTIPDEVFKSPKWERWKTQISRQEKGYGYSNYPPEEDEHWKIAKKTVWQSEVKQSFVMYMTRWIIIWWMCSVVRIRRMSRFSRSRRRSITPWPRPWRPVVPATRKRSWYIAYRHYSRFQSVYWLSVHSFAACFWCLLLFMPFYCL